jgi:type III secretory pathway component EscT
VIGPELAALFVLGFFRAMGLLVNIPLGSSSLSAAMRFGCAALLSILGLSLSSDARELSYLHIGAEFLIGFCLGLPAGLLLSGAAMFGELFDTGRGQSIGSLYDPFSASHDSQLAVMFRQFTWAYILFLGGGEILIGDYLESLHSVTLGAPFETNELLKLGAIMVTSTCACLSGVLSAYLPCAALFLMLDLGLGFLGKLLPQHNFASESFILKSGLGAAILWGMWRLDLAHSASALLQVRPL